MYPYVYQWLQVTHLQEAVVSESAKHKPKVTTPTTFTVNLRNYCKLSQSVSTKMYQY